MEDFKPGDECYHKATSKKCVVIGINEDKTIKVRTENDEERDYHPVELRKAESAIIDRNDYDDSDPIFSMDDRF